jgi:hypothetical protein
MIALAVLLVVVVGALQFTGQNREASAVKMRGEASAACAEAARRYLISRLRLNNVQVESLTLAEQISDDPNPAKQSTVMTGHYDFASAVDATGLVSAGSLSSTRRQVRDVANTAPVRPTLGGTPYRVVVKCREATGREQEVEFVFRYGL